MRRPEMGAFAYHRPAPVPSLCHWHSLTIGDLEKRCFTGKTIACGAYGDTRGDVLASDAVCL